MNAKRVHGSLSPKLVEELNGIIPVYAVRWDVHPNEGNQGSNAHGSNYMEVQLWHKPSLDECKQVIFDWFNEEIDREITEGFVWNGMRVWLSTENQFNYKAAFDLATMTGGATLPVTFKFGTTEEPVYHEFKTVEEITGFYTASMEYVTTCLKCGWIRKDGFDFTPYGPEDVPVEEEPAKGEEQQEQQ